MLHKGSKMGIGFIIALVAAVAIISCAGYVTYQKFFNKQYVALFLTTGDVYYGEKSGLTGNDLKNAFFLQKAQDGSVGLQKFSDAIWMPVGNLHVMKDKVVFWSEMSTDSPIAKVMRGEQVGTPAGQAPQGQAPAQPNVQPTAPAANPAEPNSATPPVPAK